MSRKKEYAQVLEADVHSLSVSAFSAFSGVHAGVLVSFTFYAITYHHSRSLPAERLHRRRENMDAKTRTRTEDRNPNCHFSMCPALLELAFGLL